MEQSAFQFIADGGVVSVIVAVTLLVMSIVSWYLMLTKAWQLWQSKKTSQQFSTQFWQATSIQQGLHTQQPNTPISRLATLAVEAAEHHGQYQQKVLDAMCNQDEFVARSMRRSIADEQAKLEAGLSVLASVGSVAPFVGLFGTVWGIYHALIKIGATGQASIDKVAGPVGEALIMTALGLAVAIPAVLAYNALVRGNRVLMSQLEAFAHDLHTLLITGSAMNVRAMQQVNKVKEAKA